MPAIMGHSPFAITKPPAGSQIEWGHPLAFDYGFALDERGGRLVSDKTGRGQGVLASTQQWSPSPGGGGLKFVRASSETFNVGSNYPAATSGLSVVVGIIPTIIIGANNYECMIGRLKGTAGINTDWGFVNHSGTAPVVDNCPIVEGRNDAGGAILLQWPFVLSLGRRYHLAFTLDAAGFRGYTDGHLDCTGAAPATFPSGNGNLNFGVDAAGIQFSDCILEYAWVYNRKLSADEILRLANEPYAMLRGPDVYRRYFLSASASVPKRSLVGAGT
jgi:hypothetical protein